MSVTSSNIHSNSLDHTSNPLLNDIAQQQTGTFNARGNNLSVRIDNQQPLHAVTTPSAGQRAWKSTKQGAGVGVVAGAVTTLGLGAAVATGVAKGAALGAIFGSFIPLFGTGTGAIIGGIVGGLLATGAGAAGGAVAVAALGAAASGIKTLFSKKPQNPGAVGTQSNQPIIDPRQQPLGMRNLRGQ
jgi:hypothetical protein